MTIARRDLLFRVCIAGLALFILLAIAGWYYTHTHSRTASQMLLDDQRVIDSAIQQYSVSPASTPTPHP